MAVVAMLSVIAVAITWLGVTSLKSMDQSSDRMEAAAGEATMAQRLVVNLLAINRDEFELATDPRPENAKEMRAAVTSESKRFQENVQWFKDKALNPQLRAKLTELESDWARYQKELENTFKAAAAVQHFEMTAEMNKLREEALTSAHTAEKVRTNLRMLADGLQKEVDSISVESKEEYLRVSKLMMIVASIGIALGLAGGFMIGQYGIAAPLRDLVGPLDKIAEGDFAVEVPGTKRKDEVGQIASSVQQMAEKVRTTITEIKQSGREVTNASAEI
ncbi:MAG: HAMP domain-containing protein, partial [Pseudolabrys sp.]